MKIIILGAGQVGRTVAQNLAGGVDDITVVDQAPHLLRDLQQQLDIRTVMGQASHPDVLLQAGIEDADLVLAVTNSDEINMVACQVAHSMFHTPTRLARVRSPNYLVYPQLFEPNAVPVDVLVSPERLVTGFIHHLVEQPGVLQVLDFLDGRVQLAAVRVRPGAPMEGLSLADLARHLPAAEARVVGIFRRDCPIAPEGETVIEADDEVFFLATRQHVPAVVGVLRQAEGRNRRVVIAGGGNVGKRLAELLEDKYRVRIIERDPARSRHLAETLERALVLEGDAADADTAMREDIQDADVFCAVTNDDETNILCAMLAKRLGVRKTLAIVNRPSYADLAQEDAVDIAVSPAQVTIGELLTHIRRGDFVAVHSLRRGASEAIEVVAHGDPETSKVVGWRIDELPLPEGTRIGAIARGEELILPHGDEVIESEDHVVLFLADKRKIGCVERLFQVAVTYV